MRKEASRPILRLAGGVYELVEDWTPSYGPTVPKGFKTNGMSSPKWLSVISIGNDDNRMLSAAVCHDYCYTRQAHCARKRADVILFKNLRRFGVDYVRSEMIYLAVRTFGAMHYEGVVHD